MFNFLSLLKRELDKVKIIALGAVPGAFIRWQIDDYFVVNIFGAAFLGFLMSLPVNKKYHLLFGVGFCGSLTTFSGWMVDSAELILNGSFLKALVLILYLFICGLVSAAFGFFVGALIKSSRPFLSRFLFRRY